MKKAWILAAVGALAFAGCGSDTIVVPEVSCNEVKKVGYNCSMQATLTKQPIEEQLENLQEQSQVTDARISNLEVRMNKVAPTPKPPSYDGYWFKYPTDGGFTWKVYPNNY